MKHTERKFTSTPADEAVSPLPSDPPLSPPCRPPFPRPLSPSLVSSLPWAKQSFQNNAPDSSTAGPRRTARSVSNYPAEQELATRHLNHWMDCDVTSPMWIRDSSNTKRTRPVTRRPLRSKCLVRSVPKPPRRGPWNSSSLCPGLRNGKRARCKTEECRYTV